jgi:hypothetical protein
VVLRWRRAAEVKSGLAAPPSPSRSAEEGYLPEPCTLTAEPLTDFPYPAELPVELHPALEALIRKTADSDVITRVARWKLGGWPTWHLTHPSAYQCRTCDTNMTLLFTVASDDETGVIVGRWGDLRGTAGQG